jgi:hypothetical protein
MEYTRACVFYSQVAFSAVTPKRVIPISRYCFYRLGIFTFPIWGGQLTDKGALVCFLVSFSSNMFDLC